MRKILILVIMVFAIFGSYTVVTEGFTIGETFAISNYKEINNATLEIDTLISQLTETNDTIYPRQEEDLKDAITNYQNSKEEYEELSAIVGENTLEDEISLVDIYDVDFLWTIIGNYGTEEGISLKFDIAKSTSAVTLSTSDYTICDLKFTISGDYITLTDFIYDLEDDSRLNFEISNFSLSKGGDNLQATFVVKEVPINNENLTEITTSIDTGATSSSDEMAEDSESDTSDTDVDITTQDETSSEAM